MKKIIEKLDKDRFKNFEIVDEKELHLDTNYIKKKLYKKIEVCYYESSLKKEDLWKN